MTSSQQKQLLKPSMPAAVGAITYYTLPGPKSSQLSAQQQSHVHSNAYQQGKQPVLGNASNGVVIPTAQSSLRLNNLTQYQNQPVQQSAQQQGQPYNNVLANSASISNSAANLVNTYRNLVADYF